MTVVGTWPNWECPLCGWGIAVNDAYAFAQERVQAGSTMHIDLHVEEFADQMSTL